MAEVREANQNDATTSNHPAKEGCSAGGVSYVYRKRRTLRPRTAKVSEPQCLSVVRCKPHRLINLIHKLNSRQRRWLERARWGKILRLRVPSVDRRLCSWLMRRFDPATKTLTMRTAAESADGREKTVKLSDEMVSFVLVIPYNWNPREVPRTSSENREYKRLKRSYQCEGGIDGSLVRRKALAEKTNRSKFLRHFILFALGSTLCTAQSDSFSSRHLKVLTDKVVRHPGRYNWAGYVLDWLVECSVKSSRMLTGVVGSALLLMIVYLDRINLGSGVRWSSGMPRISAWCREDILKAIKADTGENGEFGHAEIVDNVIYNEGYPIGRGSELDFGSENSCSDDCWSDDCGSEDGGSNESDGSEAYISCSDGSGSDDDWSDSDSEVDRWPPERTRARKGAFRTKRPRKDTEDIGDRNNASTANKGKEKIVEQEAPSESEEGSSTRKRIEKLIEELRGTIEEMENLESLNQTLIAKERESNNELQNVRKELIAGLSDLPRGRAHIGIKRMGQFDLKPFRNACKWKFGKGVNPDIEAAQLCSEWQEQVNN